MRTPRTDEEWSLGIALDIPIAQAPIARQRLNGARMQRYLPRLGEFGTAYRKHADFQIDIAITQMKGFGNPWSGCGKQAKQGLVTRATQVRAQLPCRTQ